MPSTISPFVMVIFGATGDLTARKLMPALHSLLSQKILPSRFFVVGFARRGFTHEEFRDLIRQAIEKYVRREKVEPTVFQRLSQNLYYQQGFFEEDAPYQKLIELLASFDKEMGACITRFFYLATPPEHYATILRHLATTRLAEGCGQGSNKWTRVLIEKPFGKDPEMARKLEEELSRIFEERQIYRIDHYLAKETVQNILIFRFANRIFEPLWNKNHIDHIQLTLAEEEGVGKRGRFYEGVGALRDMAQNHLMAMLAYITMGEPENFSAEAIRRERVKVLSFLRPILRPWKNNIARGQYGKGVDRNGRPVLGYREEEEVDSHSTTETYVAFKLFINNHRWDDVPFYLRTGKRLKESVVRIDIQFREPVGSLVPELKSEEGSFANILTFRIQPKEGISLRFFSKAPGLGLTISPVDFDFNYSQVFKKEIIDSYEKLLIDAMLGDQTLFATRAGFAATWEFIKDIMNYFKRNPSPPFPNYPAGSWGPKEAEELIGRDGRRWFLP